MDAENRLVGALFESLAEPDWATAFLQGTCAATRSHAAAVLSVDTAIRRQALPAFVGAGKESAIAFEQTHSAGNPWRPADETRGPPTGAVVVPDDAFPVSALRKTPFWQQFLRPLDVDHAAGVIGLRLPHRVVSMTLLRSHRQGAYEGAERALLGRISPHWVNACRLRSRLTPADRDGRDAVHALDTLSTAVFFLDQAGRCARWNAAADTLLRDGSLVQPRGGRLVAASPGPGSMVLAATGPTVLRHKDGTVAGHAATHALPSGGTFGGASAVVFVDMVEASRPLDVQQALRAAFGLTLREAELAVRLADGSELAAVAEAMGISVGAARTRLKTVFGKTGTRYQGGRRRAGGEPAPSIKLVNDPVVENPHSARSFGKFSRPRPTRTGGQLSSSPQVRNLEILAGQSCLTWPVVHSKSSTANRKTACLGLSPSFSSKKKEISRKGFPALSVAVP